jgi:hypothetical protein
MAGLEGREEIDSLEQQVLSSERRLSEYEEQVKLLKSQVSEQLRLRQVGAWGDTGQ